MGGAALAEVDLDRVRRPGAVGVPHHHEVDGEPAEHTLPRAARPTAMAGSLISRE